MSQPSISLCLVLHNHQPVGNFGFVLEDNHRRAYLPMLEALERHRHVRVGLHYTGPLLEWLIEHQPATVERLRALVDRGQVEMLGGGYCEPVLASLPERDRVSQLARMADEVEQVFGHRPHGAWLAERVWEPSLPVSLAAAGYRWTILDDAHFRAAGIPDAEHWGAWTTDDQGSRIMVFGTEQGLRYRIPFKPPQDVIDYLRSKATPDGDRVGMMGDDGEKFGAWPTTWELCWGREAWVDRFFAALEANIAWLTTITPSDAIAGHRPAGHVYVPTGSYAEMGEWALPVEERIAFTETYERAQHDGRPEARWLRGGFWRNFQAKYREINDLHKQMLRVSDKVAAVVAGGGAATDDGRAARIVDHLHRGQSNDCYWHGLFGGIYISHMRLATLEHLIAAEDGADRLARQAGQAPDGVLIADLDLDGLDEILVTQPGQVLAIKPSEGAGIGSWDVRAVRHGLTSVMRRRPEAYHQTLRRVDVESGPQQASEGVTSIHEIVRVREPGLSRRLWYDAYERRSGLVHILATDVAPEAFTRAEHIELGDFVAGAFSVEPTDDGSIVLVRDGHVVVDGVPQPVTVRKSLAFDGERRAPGLTLTAEVTNRGDAAIVGRLGIEWAINMLGGGGNPQASTTIDGQRHAFDSEGTAEGLGCVAMGNDGVGIGLELCASPAGSAWWSSIDTISVSEDGFERNHQGSCLLFTWPLRLEPGAGTVVEVRARVSTDRDRAESEGL